MHLWFSFSQSSSYFSWDTHSKQSLCLDEEGFLWLSLCSFSLWSNFFDLCRTLHALDASLSCICASCIFLYALFDCFCIWSYFYTFVFVCVKIQKPHKKWKIQKVWLYMFEHISHVSLALYFRTNSFMHLRV